MLVLLFMPALMMPAPVVGSIIECSDTLQVFTGSAILATIYSWVYLASQNEDNLMHDGFTGVMIGENKSNGSF